MRRKIRTRKPNRHKTKLGLPDLEHVKSAVIVSLRSPESQRSYRRSIEDFVSWYCSEPRLSFNKTVVTRYRIHLEDKLLAPGTINVRLAAVRRLAYEAADAGLLSPDLAAGIRRVKGAKKLGIRLGNWLTVDEARSLWQFPNSHTVKGKRDRAILATLLGSNVRSMSSPRRSPHFLVITTVAAILIALRQTVIAQKQTEIAQKATEKLDEQQREVTDWLVKTGHSELSRLRHIVQKRE